MNIERSFEDLGIDAVTGVRLMDVLNVSPHELALPQRFSRLSTIIDYLKLFSEDTQRFLINKATRGKPIDKLDHMFEYVDLLKQKTHYDQVLEDAKAKVSALEMSGDSSELSQAQVDKEVAEQSLRAICEEIILYER